jgi:hypothetical protein
MTEAEWLACDDPTPMLEFACGRHGDRKVRLFAVARCRHYWHELEGDAARGSVEVAERYADGLVAGDHLARAREAAWQVVETAIRESPGEHDRIVRAAFAQFACQPPGSDLYGRTYPFHPPHPALDAELVRDIYGNPFHYHSLDPAWLTSTVTALARGMYESRDFGAMPILADALQDAGCDSAEVLDHCRGPGPHVRGCWVVDLVLGKA